MFDFSSTHLSRAWKLSTVLPKSVITPTHVPLNSTLVNSIQIWFDSVKWNSVVKLVACRRYHPRNGHLWELRRVENDVERVERQNWQNDVVRLHSTGWTSQWSSCIERYNCLIKTMNHKRADLFNQKRSIVDFRFCRRRFCCQRSLLIRRIHRDGL